MNRYKYIVFTIQDMSNAELIHSAVENGYDNGEYRLSEIPLQYFISADKLEELETTKEIMEAALNNIYEVKAEESYNETTGEVVIKAYPVYFDSFAIYNLKIEEMKNKIMREKARKNKKSMPGLLEFTPPKKLPKNRFQVLQSFSNSIPSRIELFVEF